MTVQREMTITETKAAIVYAHQQRCRDQEYLTLKCAGINVFKDHPSNRDSCGWEITVLAYDRGWVVDRPHGSITQDHCPRCNASLQVTSVSHPVAVQDYKFLDGRVINAGEKAEWVALLNLFTDNEALAGRSE